MKPYHDPVRQENYLWQSLAQAKMPVGLFLGAGCPSAIKDTDGRPLIPDVAGLTAAICEELRGSDKRDSFETLYSHFAKDGRMDLNIEDILSHIRSLRQAAGRDTVRGLTAAQLDTLDNAICEAVVRRANKELPSRETPYHKVASWIAATLRDQPVEIFTPNYDLLMEQALEENRVPYFDGFVGSRRTFFDPQAMEEDRLPPRWARLWKLHGSINWRQDDKGVVSRGEQVVTGQIRVIHPSHLKYDESRRMPYLAMIDRLRAFLRQHPSVLVTCGYSFRDDHLNEILGQGLQGNPNAAVFGLLYGPLGDYSKAISLAGARPNLILLATDEGITGTRRASWVEKESVDEGAPSIAVEWVPGSESKGKEVKRARFNLGEFTRFADFLEHLIGADKERGKERSGG
jgi:hypothetical protein